MVFPLQKTQSGLVSQAAMKERKDKNGRRKEEGKKRRKKEKIRREEGKRRRHILFKVSM